MPHPPLPAGVMQGAEPEGVAAAGGDGGEWWVSVPWMVVVVVVVRALPGLAGNNLSPALITFCCGLQS